MSKCFLADGKVKLRVLVKVWNWEQTREVQEFLLVTAKFKQVTHCISNYLQPQTEARET